MKFSLKKWGGGVLPRLSNLSNYFLSARSKIFSYFSSKFLILKKGFTLVELSIVLLVLALLVSTLLVGRQIIDRAKVQQIMNEIDYYQKNFQMFRDQYDFLPGALGVENCKKYPEFSLQKGDEPTQYPSQCDDPTSQKTLLSESTAYTTYKQANFSMVDMVVSGMVENRSPGERRRKKFDIATVEEVVCIGMPAVQGGYYRLKKTDLVSELDTTQWVNSGFVGIDNNRVRIEAFSNISCNTNGNGDGFGYNKCNSKMTIGSNQLSCNQHNMNCSNNTSTTVYARYQAANVPSSYIGIVGEAFLKLSPYGRSVHNGEQVQECETRVIPGEPRLGYLLKQDEIENQANKSSFDSKTWITYSGGKVDRTMIYGFGDTTLAGAGDASAIVFFHFDADKNELTDDGAVSYALYDLIVKKLGEKKDGSSIGNIIPYSKSSGQGFNFGYIMR